MNEHSKIMTGQQGVALKRLIQLLTLLKVNKKGCHRLTMYRSVGYREGSFYLVRVYN